MVDELSSFGFRRSIRKGDVWNQSLGVVLVDSTLEKINLPLYLRSTDEIICVVCDSDVTLMRQFTGDGNTSA